MTMLDSGPATAAHSDEAPAAASSPGEPTADVHASSELAGTSSPPDAGPGVPSRPRISELVQLALTGGLAAAAAGFTTGGIFDSWTAQALGVASALAGAAGAVLALRARRDALALGLFPLFVLFAGLASLVGTPQGPGGVVALVQHAIHAGSLLQPPVPFDPGWRFLIIVTLTPLGFAAAWVATALQRPRLAVAVPLPAVAVTAITLPDSQKAIGGGAAFVLILAALAMVFGSDVRQARQLGGRFELRRALKAVIAIVPVIAVLVGLNNASFLFPKPVYNPTSTPQKPRLVSSPPDEVLFTVTTKSGFTGPWRTGALDVYEHDGWLLPPTDPHRLQPVASNRPLPGAVQRPGAKPVTLRLLALGDTPVLPDLAGTESVTTNRSDISADPRTGVLRMKSGRAPTGFTYTLNVPPYASDAQLQSATPAAGPDLAQQLNMPPPPPQVKALLAQSRQLPDAFDQLHFLMGKLLETVTASGPGVPVNITPDRVQDLLFGSKTGTPFEIVAAEAMLARWVRIPSRIGFGFDGLNKEPTGVMSVRPRNSAQWLEVNFGGYGWLPLIGTPRKAQADLNKAKNPLILANNDIAVLAYVPYKIVTAKQLYEKIRYYLSIYAPIPLGLVFAYLAWPVLAKARRRARRRHWAAQMGPAMQVAVEYAEFRDVATDLNVGDRYATPLEYAFHTVSDDEHLELAWLVSRVLYGDLAATVDDSHVIAAEELATSLRRRLRHGQALPTRLLALIATQSIVTPFEPLMPNARAARLPRVMPGINRAWRRLGTKLRRLPASIPSLRRRTA